MHNLFYRKCNQKWEKERKKSSQIADEKVKEIYKINKKIERSSLQIIDTNLKNKITEKNRP